MGIISDIATSAYNLFTAERQHKEQNEINRINLGIAQDQNQLAKEQFYNGVSVRAQDLENAGLSKTLATGASASAGSMSSSNMTPATAGKLEKLELLNARKQNELLQAQIDSLDWDNKSKKHNYDMAEKLNTVVGSQPSDVSQLLRGIYDTVSNKIDPGVVDGVADEVQSFADTISGAVSDISKLSGNSVKLSDDPYISGNVIIQVGKFTKSVPKKVVTRTAGLFKLAGMSFEDGFINLLKRSVNKNKNKN